MSLSRVERSRIAPALALVIAAAFLWCQLPEMEGHAMSGAAPAGAAVADAASLVGNGGHGSGDDCARPAILVSGWDIGIHAAAVLVVPDLPILPPASEAYTFTPVPRVPPAIPPHLAGLVQRSVAILI